MQIRKFKFRSKILLLFVLFWTVAITVRLFYYTTYERNYFLKQGDKIAWRKGIVPAARGKILDRNSIPLAWTERCFDLKVEKKAAISLNRQNVLKQIEAIFPNLQSGNEEEGVLIKKNLNPEQIEKIKAIVIGSKGVRIVPRLERRYVDYKEVRKYLGSVKELDGKFSGVSGVEEKNDSELSGTDSEFTFMLDRTGKMIQGTSKILKEMIPGKDVTLDLSLEEIKNLNGKNE